MLLVLLVLIYGPSALNVRTVHLPLGIDIEMPLLEDLTGSWLQSGIEGDSLLRLSSDTCRLTPDTLLSELPPVDSVLRYSLPDSGLIRI